jgi:replicative DNA helicase
MTEQKFPFSIEFQKKLLKLMLTDVEFFLRYHKWLKNSYFDNEILEWIFKMLITYYNEFSKLPSELVFVEELKKLKDKDLLQYVGVLKEVLTIAIEEPEFIENKIVEFTQRNIFVRKIKDIINLYNNGDFDEALKETERCIEETNKIKQETEDRTFFFKDFQERVLRRFKQMESVEKFTTGIFYLDTIIHGGLGRGELGIIVADAKAGKSIFLINVGSSVLNDHANNNKKVKVLHINLEGKDGQVEDRFESRLLNEEYNKVKTNQIDFTRMINSYKRHFEDSLIIRNMIDKWDYTVLDIEAELKTLKTKGFIPDVLIVDYGDLLSPRLASKDSTYLAQQEVFRDLKTIAIKYNCVVWTASQVARPRPGDNINDTNFFWTRHNLADCYAKVRVCDLLATINITPVERLQNKARLYLDSYRDSECGAKLSISTNYKNMMFFNPSNQEISDSIRPQL